MAINLIDVVTRAIPPDAVASITRLLGENESTVRGGLGAVIPVLLGGMASKAATPAGASSLLDTINHPSVDPDLAGNFGAAVDAGQHAALKQVGGVQLSSLFGVDKVAGLSRALAGLTGMSASSATSLLMTALPLVFGVIRRVVGEQHLDAGGLSSLFASQKDALASKLDPRLTSALGLGSPAAMLSGLGDAAGAHARDGFAAAGAAGAAVVAARPRRWWPWAVGALVLLALLWLMERCSHAPLRDAAPGASASATESTLATTPAPAPAATLPAKVYFTTGSAEPTADGVALVQSVAAMLVATPTLRVDLTGFADKTGSADVNADLAKKRAQGVAASLQAAGVAADRIALKPPLFVEAGAGGSDAEARRVDIVASP